MIEVKNPRHFKENLNIFKTLLMKYVNNAEDITKIDQIFYIRIITKHGSNYMRIFTNQIIKHAGLQHCKQNPQ